MNGKLETDVAESEDLGAMARAKQGRAETVAAQRYSRGTLRRLLAVLVLLMLGQAVAQKPIRPDGISQKAEHHKVILTECDTVRIKAPLRELTVHDGVFEAYWFKKYSDMQHFEIDCEVEASPHAPAKK